jgi:putative transcriptional regulator
LRSYLPLFLNRKINPSYFPLEINGRFERKKKKSPVGATENGQLQFICILKNSHFRDILILLFYTRWRITMAVSYKKLFHMMIEKEMTNAELQQKAGFSANIITRLKRNGYISLESIENICRVMDCGVDDILEFVPDEKK